MLYKREQIESKSAEEKIKDIIKGLGKSLGNLQSREKKKKITSPGGQTFKHLKERTEQNLVAKMYQIKAVIYLRENDFHPHHQFKVRVD